MPRQAQCAPDECLGQGTFNVRLAVNHSAFKVYLVLKLSMIGQGSREMRQQNKFMGLPIISANNRSSPKWPVAVAQYNAFGRVKCRGNATSWAWPQKGSSCCSRTGFTCDCVTACDYECNARSAASGSFSTMVSRAAAGPVGWRRCCSQFLSVATFTPIS